MNTKYNYIFLNISEPCYEPVLWPLDKYPFVKVFKYAFKAGALTNKLFFLHWSAKLNRKVKLPLKNLWFSKIAKHKFDTDKPCCYVFLGGKYISEEKKLYDYIKKLNPENKVVILCGDLIAKKNWDIDIVKSRCDILLTYDECESETYGAVYYPWMSFYGATKPVTTPDSFENDVYFVGFAKDRLPEIHQTYETLSKSGLKCKFIVCGTEEADRINGEGLCYSDPVSYDENIENIRNSRCVLEIIQGGSSAPTLRLSEAVTYKRKLITNNPNPFYREKLSNSNLFVYEHSSKIPADFATEPIDYDGFFAGEENPLEFIRFFEKTLSNSKTDL